MKQVRSYVYGPLVAASWIAMSLLASISELAQRKAHWEDVAVGVALGALMALYMVSSMCEHKNSETAERKTNRNPVNTKPMCCSFYGCQ